MSRYLRIAAAVLFTMLAVGFAALWVRSYHYMDFICSPRVGRTFLCLGSHKGSQTVALSRYPRTDEMKSWVWLSFSDPKVTIAPVDHPYVRAFGFELAKGSHATVLTAPHWFLAASSFAVAALFFFNRTWRFTVRGLLMAMTIIAAMLGLVVYAV